MSNYYNLDGIKTELKKRIDIDNSFLNAWKNVKFCSKKDGTNFKVMSKNFKNATYDQKYNVYENELTVHVFTLFSGYKNDSINCYETVNQYNENDEKFKNKPENIRSCGYYKTYVYDVDDIKQAIEKRINYLETEIKDLQNELDNADIIYTMFKNDFSTTMNNLEKACKEITTNNKHHCDIYYMIKDLFFEKYPYC